MYVLGIDATGSVCLLRVRAEGKLVLAVGVRPYVEDHLLDRRPADGQHSAVNLVSHAAPTPVVGRSPLATPGDLGA